MGNRRLTTDLDIAALAGWGGPDGLPRVMRHPRFAAAGRALAAGMLALADRDPALRAVFKDAGRYVAAMCAFHLDAAGGLTLPALKAACVRTGFLSPGRARALLGFLVHIGYAVAERTPRRGAVTAYVLTPAFRDAWRAQLAAALSAAREIEPAVGAVLERLGDPATLAVVAQIHSQGLSDSAEADAAPPMHAFLHAHAGTQILWVLLTGGEGQTLVPDRAGPISVAGLARRFDVSRVHVKRIFAEAAREGLAELGPDGVVAFTDRARGELNVLYALQLAQLLAAAARTAEAWRAVAEAA